MRRFESDGLTLAFDDVNAAGATAGPVLLVHGFATDCAESWRRLGWYGALERKGHRAVGLDLRGHGESDKPHEPDAYDRERMAADLIRLLDHLELSRVDLIGYSLGAHLACAAAAASPWRFASLVLGGVGGRAIEDPGARAPEGATSLAEAMEAADPEAIDDPILRGFRRFAEAQNADRAALAACSRARGSPLAERLDSLTMPVLVIAGERDEIAGDPDLLAARIPGARAVRVPGCDHFSAIPHALFKAAVFDFLDGWLE